MFSHADRFPTGTPLPSGQPTPPPWGLARMAPYPAAAPAYARSVLDPITQTTRYFDAAGGVVEMPGHGTSTGTNPSTGTSPDGNAGSGDTDTDTGNDADQ
ncbi:putative ATP-grasp-modified RiPP [Actinacidiphila glaucinigra]|nr:putative ATP-grasp-modified RiPP [Actinacidiphila glaucinigra]WSD64913.1 putative ATP-grasp-modified RiPP [Actinacidiphila glaucinigra]